MKLWDTFLFTGVVACAWRISQSYGYELLPGDFPLLWSLGIQGLTSFIPRDHPFLPAKVAFGFSFLCFTIYFVSRYMRNRI